MIDLQFVCYTSPTGKDRVTIDMIGILNSIHLPLQIVSFVSISLLVFLLLTYLISPTNNDLQLKCTVSLAVAFLLRLSLRISYYLYGGDPNFYDREICGIIGKLNPLIQVYVSQLIITFYVCQIRLLCAHVMYVFKYVELDSKILKPIFKSVKI